MTNNTNYQSGTQRKIGEHGAMLEMLREDMRNIDHKVDRVLSTINSVSHSPPCKEFIKFQSEINGAIRGVALLCTSLSIVISLLIKVFG